MKYLQVLGILVMSLIGVTNSYAQSAPKCTEYKEAEGMLKEKYGEIPTHVGLLNQKTAMFVLLESKDGESWTILGLDTKGMACLIGAGELWSDIEPAPGEPVNQRFEQ